jgi:hypothetical protein
MHNPYASPSSDHFARTEAYMSSNLASRTNRLVTWVGLFEFLAWIIMAFWTDKLFLDIFVLFIATNGARIGPKSCRIFPWTAVMCVVYPFSFLFQPCAIQRAGLCQPASSPTLTRFWTSLIFATCGGLTSGLCYNAVYTRTQGSVWLNKVMHPSRLSAANLIHSFLAATG